MARYIDADKLITALCDCTEDTWGKGLGASWWAQSVKLKDNMVECINNQPTADVVEVKHGEWKGESLTCSVCKRDISEIYDADSYMSYGIEDELKWCPFCGAKMDGNK